MTEVLLTFTFKSRADIFSIGGIGYFRNSIKRVEACPFVVCIRNREDDRCRSSEPHHAAFLAGRVSSVEIYQPEPNRKLIRFSEFALLNITHFWTGDRNPIRYLDINEFGIEFERLGWQRMPH